jgi:REP element-mobilizing transposase RayT
MAQSLSKIYLHIIFHVKSISPTIAEEHLERVFGYIGQLVNSTGCHVIRVGGMHDHIHIICVLSSKETISHLIEEIKRNSSRWLKTVSPIYKNFAWQGGYAAYSISQSIVDKTIEYVSHQKEHHMKVSFREEYEKLLTLYQIDYNPNHVFND